MRQEITSPPSNVGLRLDRSPPLSSMCREVGLAAVAAELHLPTNELEIDAAIAVERGAAALFLAGFGPKVARARKAKPGASKARRPSAKAGRRPASRRGTRG